MSKNRYCSRRRRSSRHEVERPLSCPTLNLVSITSQSRTAARPQIITQSKWCAVEVVFVVPPPSTLRTAAMMMSQAEQLLNPHHWLHDALCPLFVVIDIHTRTDERAMIVEWLTDYQHDWQLSIQSVAVYTDNETDCSLFTYVLVHFFRSDSFGSPRIK